MKYFDVVCERGAYGLLGLGWGWGGGNEIIYWTGLPRSTHWRCCEYSAMELLFIPLHVAVQFLKYAVSHSSYSGVCEFKAECPSGSNFYMLCFNATTLYVIHILRNVTLHKIPGAGFWCSLSLTLACLLNMNCGL